MEIKNNNCKLNTFYFLHKTNLYSYSGGKKYKIFLKIGFLSFGIFHIHISYHL